MNMFCNVKVTAIFYGVRLVIRRGVPIAFINNAKNRQQTLPLNFLING